MMDKVTLNQGITLFGARVERKLCAAVTLIEAESRQLPSLVRGRLSSTGARWHSLYSTS